MGRTPDAKSGASPGLHPDSTCWLSKHNTYLHGVLTPAMNQNLLATVDQQVFGNMPELTSCNCFSRSAMSCQDLQEKFPSMHSSINLFEVKLLAPLSLGLPESFRAHRQQLCFVRLQNQWHVLALATGLYTDGTTVGMAAWFQERSRPHNTPVAYSLPGIKSPACADYAFK